MPPFLSALWPLPSAMVMEATRSSTTFYLTTQSHIAEGHNLYHNIIEVCSTFGSVSEMHSVFMCVEETVQSCNGG
jgi:hypothetical protein